MTFPPLVASPGHGSGGRLDSSSRFRSVAREVAGALLAAALLAVCGNAAALAETVPPSTDPATVQALRDEMAALRRDYEARLAALEARLAALESAPAAAAMPAPVPAAAPAASGPANYFNPAMAMIANVVGSGGSNPMEDSPSVSLRESELSLSAAIDPYARADFFLGFSEEGVSVEEGYATFTALPGQWLAKVGRQRVPFGKVNTLHSHALSWVDAPLPMQSLVGGEEGWKDDGVTLSRLIPLGDTFSELSVSLLRGRAEGLFAAERKRDLASNVHFRLFRDLSDASNVDLGLSWARGANGSATGFDTTLAGVDVSWRWKPLRTATSRSLLVRGELVQSRREQPDGTVRATGWYLSGDWQLARRWTIGGRLESSERALEASQRDDGAALLLTFRPSEFQLLRAELRRRRYAEEITADELFVQMQFLIGAHGAHAF
ncbi:MAG: hypothetical protein IPJ17_10865 [Holophagales bacterium]|nr:MAG: hypothetical protein IPJ17_10865 [Holophagales bacterium]